MGVIKQSLLRLEQIAPSTVKVFAEKTRDVASLPVYIDTNSRVIFIDDFYVGEAAYVAAGSPNESPARTDGYVNHEDRMDTLRRLSDFESDYVDQSICDFGCGAGSFLKGAQNKARNVVGVELCADHRAALTTAGIAAFKTLGEVPMKIDTLFMLHSFEHMPDPSQCLRDIHQHMKAAGGGRIVIEVPHAKDFLIQTVNCQAFIDFTLWSQHLILHTAESLRAFVQDAGFTDISVAGVQRYPLSNHLHWQNAGKPGGHKTELAKIDTAETTAAYAGWLKSIDATDTLIATARV